MKYENLKRVYFLEKFILTVSSCFFLRACAHYIWLKASGVEYIVNYLILVAIYLLISQIVKAERNLKINSLSKSEVAMFTGIILLIILELIN